MGGTLLSRSCVLLLLLGMMPPICGSQMTPDLNVHSGKKPVFRAPFVLRLQIDSQHLYEENISGIPYVADNGVYLFSGESVGVNCIMHGDLISEVIYQPDLSKADITFDFSQHTSQDGPLMLLVIRNTLKRRVSLDALMTVPGDKDVHKTNVLPVEAGRSNTESWPHPIVQLLLRNFRFSEGNAK